MMATGSRRLLTNFNLQIISSKVVPRSIRSRETAEMQNGGQKRKRQEEEPLNGDSSSRVFEPYDSAKQVVYP